MTDTHAATTAQSESLPAAVRRIASVIWHDDAVRASVIVFLALRIVTGVAALIMIAAQPAPKPAWLAFDPDLGHANPSNETYDQSLPADAPLVSLVAPWQRYDTAWYIKIAIQGYRADSAIVFPPLYPALIHVIAPLCGGNYVLAALLISNIACLVAFILLHKLALREFRNNRRLALGTLICLAAFPTALFLVAAYTESLYLALTVGAFITASKRRWWVTAFLAILASLTRLQGAVLCVPLAWIAYVQYRPATWRDTLRRVPAAFGAAAGLLCYLAYLGLNQLGTLDQAFVTDWKLTTRPPWEAIKTYLDRLRAGAAAPYENANAIILVVMFVLALLVIARMRPAYALYVFSTLILILMRYHSGPQFDSLFRYALMLFPCFIVAAQILQRRWSLAVYGTLAGLWQLALLSQFVHWVWFA